MTTDVIETFFDQLGARGQDPRLEEASGTVRVDVVNGRRTDRWLLTLKKGHVSISRENAAADVVIRGQRPLLERIFRGKANAMAAWLRGELILEGFSPELLVLFQRLLPRPRDARRMGRAAGFARRSQ